MPLKLWRFGIIPIPQRQDCVVTADHDGFPPTLAGAFMGENHVSRRNRFPVLRQSRSQRWQDRSAFGWCLRTLLLSLSDFFVMASSLKSRRGPMGPLFATDRYCDFDPVDRVVYT